MGNHSTIRSTSSRAAERARRLFASLLLVLAVTLLVGADKIHKTPEQLVAVLHQGGYVIYVRHGKTDRRRDDAAQPDLKDCTTQRMLSREGEKQADELGAVFRDLKIPVGAVFCSPYCRAVETAQRVFPKKQPTAVPELGRLARMANDKVPGSNTKLRELLTRQPRAGENTVIVGHLENLTAVGGPDIDEAGWAVFHPTQTGYQLVGHLSPADWKTVGRKK